MKVNMEHLEKVNHETAARPFSIHHTYVGGENTNALYLHCHPQAEFFCLEEGELKFYVEEQEITLHSGDAIYIPPNLVHHADQELGSACSYDALVFSMEWISGYLGDEGNLYGNMLQKYRTESITVFRRDNKDHGESLKRLWHFKDYAGRPIHVYEMKLLGEIMISLQEIYNALSEKLSLLDKGDASREGVQKVIDHLLSHYGAEQTIGGMAAVSGYSESHFCHRFKAVTGYAPVAYLNRIRVIKAAERLIISDDKIAQIAADCGFDNISYFNRVFRNEMGMAPGEYRLTGRQGRWDKRDGSL